MHTCVVDFSYFQKAISPRERFILLVIKDKFVRFTCKMYGQPAFNFPNTKSSIFWSCLPLQKRNLLYIMFLSKKPFGVKWGSLFMWCKQFWAPNTYVRNTDINHSSAAISKKWIYLILYIQFLLFLIVTWCMSFRLSARMSALPTGSF